MLPLPEHSLQAPKSHLSPNLAADATEAGQSLETGGAIQSIQILSPIDDDLQAREEMDAVSENVADSPIHI